MNTAAPAPLSLERLRCFSPFDFLTEHYLRQALASLQYLQRSTGTPLLERGERSTTLYYLLDGKVWLGGDGSRRSLLAGSPQAMLALNEAQPQVEAVSAASDVHLFALERGLLERLLHWSQSADYGVVSLQADEPAQSSGEDGWLDKLLSTPLFGRLPPVHLQALLAGFEFIEAKAGDVVVRYGETGEHFYVLKQGRAAVSLPGNSDGTEHQALQPGDFFGEEALVSGAVRSATVRMLEDGVLARLDRQLFVERVRPTLVPRISSHQLQQLRRPCRLLDVRLPLEYRSGHQPGSISLPVARLRAQASDLDRDLVYAVTAEGGMRSELAVHLLNQLGFEAYLLSDGPGQPPLAA